MLLHSLPALSLAKLLTASGFHAYSNERGPLQLFIWGAGTGVFNFISSSVVPTESIINSPDNAAVFPSFSSTTTFLASYIPLPSPDTCSLASLVAGFYTYEKKGGDEEGEGIIRGAYTGVFNLTPYSGLPSDSIFTSPNEGAVFTFGKNFSCLHYLPFPCHFLIGLLGSRIWYLRKEGRRLTRRKNDMRCRYKGIQVDFLFTTSKWIHNYLSR